MRLFGPRPMCRPLTGMPKHLCAGGQECIGVLSLLCGQVEYAAEAGGEAGWALV